MHRARSFPAIVTLLLIVGAPAWASTAAARGRTPADFTGILLNGAGAVTVPVTLHVDSFTTATEVGKLARLVGDEGPSKVAAALATMKPRGWIRVGDLMGFEVPVIREFATDKGSRIFAVLDRPFPLWEELHATRSADAPFGMIELKLNLDGYGVGTLVPAGRALFADDGKLDVLSYGSKPHRIIGVTQQPLD